MNSYLMRLRHSRPVIRLRSLLPNQFVNLTIHLPKAILANIFYGFPAKKLTVIGVTGTKGKTSTAHLIYHILTKQNKKVILISTINAIVDDQVQSTGLHVTNPDPFKLQKLLKTALAKGSEFAVIEVTSHGLAQYRNWGIAFAIGVFTQVLADHTTYHGGIDKYQSSKAKLINNSQKVILNKADPSFQYLFNKAQKLNRKIITYKAEGDSFQTQNQQAAITTVKQLAISENQAKQALKSFPGVPGRMQFIKQNPFAIVIDFAHTPDSLRQALKELRKRVKNNGLLLAVFGSAGERDPNRRQMGEVAAQLADAFVITAEDPRNEGVEKISHQIAQHARRGGAKEILINGKKRLEKGTFARIPDRQQAINLAITQAKPGDVIGLFGKGHEQSMCFGTTEHPWSEHQAVKIALEKRNKS